MCVCRDPQFMRVFCAVEDGVASEWGELDDVAEDVKDNWDVRVKRRLKEKGSSKGRRGKRCKSQ